MPDQKRHYTKFEKTRIISARALQLAQGSPYLVKVPKGITQPIDIAKLEWEAGVIPIDIKRKGA
ncbi:MAG: DNA-directed RNA polymerase subunit K [Candidatus Aenigmarchaeota archaeon]|nr:DNA-directed RNA polymerase subunit K [Candidatus Aenigmarchaeota archaeon]